MAARSVVSVFDGFRVECVKCGPDAVVVEDDIALVEEYDLGQYCGSSAAGAFSICCNRCGLRTRVVDIDAL